MFGLPQRLAAGARWLRSLRPRRQTQLHLETLESRTLLSFTPAQIQHAYGFDKVTLTDFNGNNFAGDGSGQTIAIVNAYRNPNIADDLAYFDSAYGLPDPPSFREVYAQGTPANAPANTWGLEAALDVEWAHAMAPQANILLVDAQTDSRADLYGAVDVARNYPGVSVVSMSWGESEFAGENAYDRYLFTPTGHDAVTFVAGAGDTGGSLMYPAASRNVLAVGGTNLSLDGASNYNGESAWANGGGGVSAYEARPKNQNGWQSSTQRAGPDVAYSADSYSVRDTYGYTDGWTSAAGTSAGTPQWAAIAAIVNQGVAANGVSITTARSQFVPALYSLSQAPTINANDFHDITTGSSGGNAATTGFDLATGLGTPVVNNLIPDLVNTITSTALNITGTANIASGSSSHATSTGFTTAQQSALRASVKQSLGSAGQPVIHLGQPSRATPITPQAFLMEEALRVGQFGLGNANARAFLETTATAGSQRAPTASSADQFLAAPSTPLFSAGPLRLANSYYDEQNGDVMPRADDADNPGGAGKGAGRGAGAELRRDTPPQAPVPATDQVAPVKTALSPQACDACFAAGNWYSAVSEQEVKALAGAPQLGQPAAGAAAMVVALGAYWGSHRRELEAGRRRVPRLKKI